MARKQDGRGNSARKEAARKGGLAVSRDREHMAEIGRKGGESSGESRGKKNAETATTTETQQNENS